MENTNTAARPAIVKVLSIVDTREWIEGPDDRWIAVAGSGNARDCDRCGRSHEIHATVELSDRSTCIVGVGCAKAESLDVQRSLASGATRAKRAGCRVLRKTRGGVLVGLYDANAAGMESDPATPWATVCEEHGGIVCHETLRDARAYLAHPDEWCPLCQRARERNGESNP